MTCEAYGSAEAFFRQAADLNPYEPIFRVHLALSLVEQKRYPPAAAILRKILSARPGLQAAVTLLERCEREARDTSSADVTDAQPRRD